MYESGVAPGSARGPAGLGLPSFQASLRRVDDRRWRVPPGRKTEGEQAGEAALKAYLEALMTGFGASASTESPRVSADESPEAVLALLTNRDFCYLSKSKVSMYREGILALVRSAVHRGEPIHFSYDIGGGYHASTRPGEEGLRFEVGLGELFVLSQISSFSGRAKRIYPSGIKFSLVIDNVCALLVNDVPLAKTREYCEDLRRLIREVGMQELVDVLVEGEHFSVDDFDVPGPETAGRQVALTRQQHDNVERFLGRPCNESEAAERFLRYQGVIENSDRLLARLIPGVHMTQRATPSTICFRAFPGADSRIQSGEIALTRNDGRKIYPFLLSSRNIGEYVLQRHPFPGLLPGVIPYVTYAERIPT
jgi:hypothetical protein